MAQNLFFRGVRKVAYGLAKLIELPYDFVKTLNAATDSLPEAWSSTTTGRAWAHRENSTAGYLVKGLFNLVLMPTQWILGAVYKVTGLRALTNWMREAADRKVMQANASHHTEAGTNGTKQTTQELLAFLQKQRRKNNSGRGVFVFKQGNNNATDGYESITRGESCIDRRQQIDQCLDELLTPPKQSEDDASALPYASLFRYLDNCIQKISKKLGRQPSSEQPAVSSEKSASANTSYRQRPTNIFFFKKAEAPEQRLSRLENNAESLQRMIRSLN